MNEVRIVHDEMTQDFLNRLGARDHATLIELLEAGASCAPRRASALRLPERRRGGLGLPPANMLQAWAPKLGTLAHVHRLHRLPRSPGRGGGRLHLRQYRFRPSGPGRGDRPGAPGRPQDPRDRHHPARVRRPLRRPRPRADLQPGPGHRRARRMRHPEPRRRHPQRRQGPRAGADLRRRLALHPGRRGAWAAATNSSSGPRTCSTSAASSAATCATTTRSAPAATSSSWSTARCSSPIPTPRAPSI